MGFFPNFLLLLLFLKIVVCALWTLEPCRFLGLSSL